MGRPVRLPVLVAVVTGSAAVVLAILVARHVTDQLDVTIGQRIRPPGVWDLAQQRADRVVEGARPSHAALFLVGVGLAWAALRRSWRPLVDVLLIGGGCAALILAIKAVVARADPNGYVAPHSGSFPSGHTAAVIVSLGGALLVVAHRTRWWQWVLVYGAGVVMAGALLVEGAHWPTDVVGGALVATTVLAAAAGRPSRRSRRPTPAPARTTGTADSHADADSSAARMREMHLRRVGPMLPTGIPSTSAISL